MNKIDHRIQFYLPDLKLIEHSEEGFSDAFLIAAELLLQYCKQIQAVIGRNKFFTSEPFNSDILRLFGKMFRHYYSYVLLETSRNQAGSQLLIEQFSEAAITLAYLLESGEADLYSNYISASVDQARHLLVAVKYQLHEFPDQPELLRLKVQLETILTNQQEHIAKGPFSTIPPEAYLWGSQSANTTDKRGEILGLNFLTNPARQIALKVIPASWLELQLNYLHDFVQSRIDFKNLRDASYLCLHITQIFLEEVIDCQGFVLTELEPYEHLPNRLFQWFYEAYNAYQLYFH